MAAPNMNSVATETTTTLEMVRAHIICTKAISGQVMSAVHKSASPCCAPAIE